MKTTLLLLLLAVVGATWWIERMTAARLAFEIEAARTERSELDAALRDRERLRAQLADEGERARLHRASAPRPPMPAAPDREEAAGVVPASNLTLGEWRQSREWGNRGQTTPHAAIETMLWAAAGGDIASLKNLLSLADATRAKADQLFARLPASERERYASPEDLIAAFTIKAIPIGEAQLVWLNIADPDNAAAGVYLKNPPGEIGAADFATKTATAKDDPLELRPPQLASDDTSSVAYLLLHREGDAWRFVVPPSAIDKIAKDLGVSSAP